MTTCPSGVHYMHLVDHARTVIEETYRRPWHDRLLRSALGAVLPYPARLRSALAAARLGRPLIALLPGGTALGKRVRAMLALAPSRLPRRSALDGARIHPAEGTRRARVALLDGCAQRVLAPGINDATIRLLTRLGVEVVVARGAGCCGALTHHMGRHDAAMASMRANIAAWTREAEGEGLDAIVVNASGCGTTVKDYGFMFRTEPSPWRERAERVAALALDVSEFLTRTGYAPTREPPGLTVAYHSACSLQHGQSVTAEPKALLRKAGFRVVEPAEGHLCCGSAGTYNLLAAGHRDAAARAQAGEHFCDQARPDRRRQHRLPDAVGRRGVADGAHGGAARLDGRRAATRGAGGGARCGLTSAPAVSMDFRQAVRSSRRVVLVTIWPLRRRHGRRREQLARPALRNSRDRRGRRVPARHCWPAGAQFANPVARSAHLQCDGTRCVQQGDGEW